jgi:hypothetical protein
MEAVDQSAAETRHLMAPAERLLLGSLRGWAAGRLEGHVPHQAVANALAWRTSGQVAAIFLSWVQAIEAGCRRPIQADCPECGGASVDLQRLVIACGVAPVDAELSARLLEPLVTDPVQMMLLSQRLNRAFAASGWPLPARLPAGHQPAAPPPTLH